MAAIDMTKTKAGNKTVAKDPYERTSKAGGGDSYTFNGTGIGGMPEGFFPEQYKELEDFYRNMMGGGMSVGVPDYWNTAGGAMSRMARSGMPVDINAYTESLIPVHQRRLEEGSKQILESMGMGGKRWSTPLSYQVADLGSRLEENMGMASQQAWLGAQEAARQRQIAASGQLYNLGSGMTNLGFQNANMMMQGAGGMGQMAQEYMYGPMNISQGLMGMGGQYQNAQQQQYDAMQNDPYLGMAMNMANISAPQYAQKQYQPGWGSQLMDIGGMGMNFMDMMGWGNKSGSGSPYTQIPSNRSGMYGVAEQAPETFEDRYYGGGY